MAEHQFSTPPSLSYYMMGCRCDDCRDCKRVWQNEYRKAHPEIIKASRIRYRLKHSQSYKARSLARSYKYKKKHRDRVNAAFRKKLKNLSGEGRARYRAIRANVRAKRQNVKGHTSAAQMAARWQLFGGKCYICKALATDTDHVIPLSRGGTNWPSNQRPICRSCNAKKHATPLANFLKSQSITLRLF